MNNSNNFHERQGRIQIAAKEKLKILFKNYYFYEFSNEFDVCQSKILFQNIKESAITIISKYQITVENTFFILSFHNTKYY